MSERMSAADYNAMITGRLPQTTDEPLESALQLFVQEELTRNGWVWFHIPPQKSTASRRMLKGVADIPIAFQPSTGRRIVIELKRIGHKPTPEQQHYLDTAAKCDCETYVWTNQDRGVIPGILAAAYDAEKEEGEDV